MQTQICEKCFVEKVINAFPLREGTPYFNCKECCKIINRKAYLKCQKRQIIYSRNRRIKHPDCNKKYYYAHKEKCRTANKAWYKEHRDYDNAKKQRRRADKMGTSGSYTAEEWQRLKQVYNYTCLRCFDYEPNIKLTADHIKPLIHGGLNNIENIQPLCLSCNSSKKDKFTDYRCHF